MRDLSSQIFQVQQVVARRDVVQKPQVCCWTKDFPQWLDVNGYPMRYLLPEPFCCEAKRPNGFTYHQFVTVCDTCLTQFPYYDCYCELEHEDCNETTRLANIAYRERNR